MRKTTITFTALPRGTTGTAGSDGKLQLSVFIAPRLWTTETTEQEQILHLVNYPVFEDWPARVKAMNFRVAFANGSTLSAVPVSKSELRSDIWKALFTATTPVKPFRFDNLADTPIQTIDTAYLEDWLHDLYHRVGTDPDYGMGVNKPSLETMQQDPGLSAIARPSHPEPPYVPPPKIRVPIHYPPQTPEDEETESGGCLKWLIDLLNKITSALGLGKPFKLPSQALLSSSISPQNAEPGSSVPAQPQPASPPPLNAGNAPVVNNAQAATAKAKFAEVVAFVKPFEELTAIPPKLSDEELNAKLAALLDFHDGVALMADYPTLLRALGLVVDLEVDWPADLPAVGMVSVEIDSHPGVDLYSLRTHYTLSGKHFLATPRPVKTGQPETVGGLLRLSDESRYRIVQTDVVGAALKVQNAATSAHALQDPEIQPANPPTEETLPALRSAGLAVVQSDLATQLYTTYVQAVGLNNALAHKDHSPQYSILGEPQNTPEPTDELWAEDVTRGYRMDVRDLDSLSKKWRSLHQRTGKCLFFRSDPEIVFIVKDEGYVQVGTTEPANDVPHKTQRVPDVLATWTGWSLSAVRPGKSLVESNELEASVDDVPNDEETAKTAFKMITRFKPVNGSLPRLRFGHHYQLRVRTVDLAGNSAFEPDDDLQSEFQRSRPDDTPSQAYRRFEPIPSPVVVLKAQPIEGESVERLVIRSAAPGGDPQHVSRPETERHIVPPKCSQLLAEYHGQFDDADGKLRSDETTYDQAALEANTLSHYWTSGDPPALLPQPGMVPLPDGEEKKDPTFWQTHDAFPLEHFYLPDPLARQAVLKNLPGLTQNSIKHILFDGQWPKRQPFRLRVVGIPAGHQPSTPKWSPDPDDPATRVLTVELAAGEQRTIRLNSGLKGNTDLSPSQLGVWDWEMEPSPANQNQIHQNTANGLNWLLMPYRELHLVHATQKPVEMPKLQIDQVIKHAGDTVATIKGSADIDGKSTGKVDLLALWTDPEDDINKDGPSERSSRAALGEFNVTSPDMSSLTIEAKHSLGDTKYHKVTYVARGSTRFREYMPAELLKQPNVDDLLSTPTEAEIAAGNLTTVAVEDVKNSARPLAPEVVYVMPTLGYVEETIGGDSEWRTITRKRRGSGLRIYLKRPWFSSGDGELLGIVFKKEGITYPPAIQSYVTEWANDPIWDAPAAKSSPSADDFLNIAAGRATLLDELDKQVRVVGYPVEYDQDRGLWFADIEFNPIITTDPDETDPDKKTGLGTYTPMVQLALARFQPNSIDDDPNSIDDFFISRVVRTDFVQPLPDRKLTIYQDINDPLHFKVKLEGLAPNSGLARPVTAWIERLASPTQGELGWMKAQGDVFSPEILNAGSALWKGEFNLQKMIMEQYRLVIQETEPIETANIRDDTTLGRTVYMDTWEL